jgi:hypothetical protein
MRKFYPIMPGRARNAPYKHQPEVRGHSGHNSYAQARKADANRTLSRQPNIHKNNIPGGRWEGKSLQLFEISTFIYKIVISARDRLRQESPGWRNILSLAKMPHAMRAPPG